MGSTKRILFSIEDFKSYCWAEELSRDQIEVVPTGIHLYSDILSLLKGFFANKRIHLFVFRYLNDHPSFLRSVKYFIRDLVTVLCCKLLGTNVVWIMHNIDRETIRHYPRLSRLRRKLVQKSSGRILVTDPHLMESASEHGVKSSKLGWTCFGPPKQTPVDARNKKLFRMIEEFRNDLGKRGHEIVRLGLCVSHAAGKKNHYLKAHNVAGAAADDRKSCVGLILIGDFPRGPEFEAARRRVIESPYILYMENHFPVNEWFIRDHIDFFYRSMTDHSIAYSIYVACALEKPVFTHDTGALPKIVQREKIGFVITRDSDIPGFVTSSIRSWSPEGSRRFLAKRSWQVGAAKIRDAITTDTTFGLWRDSTISGTNLAGPSSD